MSVAVLFPGQGSQYVGMGADLFASRPDLLGETADEILGWSLRDLCLNGPEESLTRTEHAQVALFAVAFALWETFRASYDGPISAAAGHSLGEYTALCAAGAMSYTDGLRVVATRGEAMARAADVEPSGMAALIGANGDIASEVTESRIAQGGRLEVANLNAPGQVVVAGGSDDLAWLADNASAFGVRRVIPLKVAGAFHSGFMETAAEDVGKALSKVEFSEPAFPVWANTTARPHETAAIAAALQAQVVSTVRFEESLLDMAASGVDIFVHVGPGDVTAGMAKRSVDGATVHAISEVADIQSVSDSLTVA